MRENIVRIAACLSKCLEDGAIRPGEVREHRSELESARDALDAQLGKLRVAA